MNLLKEDQIETIIKTYTELDKNGKFKCLKLLLRSLMKESFSDAGYLEKRSEEFIKELKTEIQDCLMKSKGQSLNDYYSIYEKRKKLINKIESDNKVISFNHILEHRKQIQCLAVVQMGKRNLIASGSEDQSIKIWDEQSLTCLKTLKGHTSYVTCMIYFSKSNGKGYLLSGASDPENKILVWSTRNWCLQKTLEGHENAIQCLHHFTNEEGKEFVASGSMDQKLFIWGVKKWKKVFTLEGHTKQINCITGIASNNPQIEKGSKLIASSSEDCTIRVWETMTFSCIKVIHEEQVDLGINNLRSFSSNGEVYIACNVYNDLKFYEVKNWTVKYQLSKENTSEDENKEEDFKNEEDEEENEEDEGEDTILSMDLLYKEDKIYLLTSSSDKSCNIWDLNKMTHVGSFGPKKEVQSVIINLPSKRGNLVALCGSSNTFSIYDPFNNICLNEKEKETEHYLIVENKGKYYYLLAFAKRAEIEVWSPFEESYRYITGLKGHEGINSMLDVCFNGKAMVLSAGSDNKIFVWEVENWKLHKKLSGHTDEVFALLKTPEFVVSSSIDLTIRLWRLDNFTCAKVLKSNAVIYIFQYSEGYVMGSSQSNKDYFLRIWNLQSGSFRECKGHTEDILDIQTLEEGSSVLSCSDDKSVRAWSLSTGECLQTMDFQSSVLTMLTYTSNGRKMTALGCLNATIELWDMEEMKCVRVLKRHLQSIYNIVSFNVGVRKYMASCDEEGNLILWDLNLMSYLYTLHSEEETQRFSLKVMVIHDKNFLVVRHKKAIKTWLVSFNEKIISTAGYSNYFLYQPDSSNLKNY